MKTYNIKYCTERYGRDVKTMLIKNARNEIEAMRKLYEQIQGVFIIAIEERKL